MRDALLSTPTAASLSVSHRVWRRLNDLRERVAPAKPLGRPFAPVASGQAADDLIHDTLESGRPAMIARLGASELEAMLRQRGIERASSSVAPYLSYALGRTAPPWWDATFLDAMGLHAGFFPATPPMLAKFTRRMEADLQLVDILGSWLPCEKQLAGAGLPAIRVPLEDLEPYYHAQPWSRVLRDRVVLVVHPEASLIEAQYQRRERLFPGRDVLPPFTLKTFTPVVSLGGARVEYGDWFAALDAMIAAIAREAFDVAIIGAGAYGLPLAAAIKRMGRQAVHLGGATQILFGIRGNRWDRLPFFQHLYTEAWVRPVAATKPPRWKEMEDNGPYW